MTIFAPRRDEPLVEGDGRPSTRFADTIEDLVNDVNALTFNVEEAEANDRAYTITNLTTLRTLNADGGDVTISNPPTQAEVQAIVDQLNNLSDIFGTLVEDVQRLGMVP